MDISWFDLIVLCFFAYGSIIGFKRGLILELGNLTSLFAGLICVFRYSSNLANLINGIFGWPSFINYLISFIIIFFSITYIISILAKLVSNAIKISVLSLFNRIAGLIFGFLKYILILSFLVFFINEFFFINIFKKTDSDSIFSSLTYGPLMKVAEFLIEIIQTDGFNNENSWKNL